MCSAATKMSLEAIDVQTDEDCEELYQTTRRKRSSAKPPSKRSPYLSSMNMNPRRVAVAAWRLPRASLGDTRGETPGDMGSACLTSLSNGHDASQKLRSECSVTPKLLKQTLSLTKNLNSASSGVTRFNISTVGFREKEDMHEEIIHLKKSLQAQKSDNRQMKAKLRHLEEDNAKREKQIEELLDPTKASEYTRSLVDKKKDGSVVLNGLKQRILKLEQQYREKENALSKLQRELRTSNLEELKITVETYYEEIQRLRTLLEAAEKSSRAESKCSQRQQRMLNSSVQRLSERLKQLQQEKTALREELNTDSPAGGAIGYREWSKQRLLRRLLELERRLEDSRKHNLSARSCRKSDQEIQTTPVEILGSTMATEAEVSVGTITEGWEEVTEVRERISQLEKERLELNETLSINDDELMRLREDRELERERWKAEQTEELVKVIQQHKEELDKLRATIQTLEEGPKPAQSELSSLSPTLPEEEDTQVKAHLGEVEKRDTGVKEELNWEGDKQSNSEKKERKKAALLIQTNWRKHRHKDIVMLQSALRGQLLRDSQLKNLLEETNVQAVAATNHSGAVSSVDEELDDDALMMIQSAFRGHLARSSLPAESLSTLSPRRARSEHTASRAGLTSLQKNSEKPEEGDPWLTFSAHSPRTPTTDQIKFGCTAKYAEAAAVESDDSDDIIVSPSRPLRSREVLIL